MIKVYTAQGCAYCQMVKRYLKSKGTDYEEVDIDKNPFLRDELIEKTRARSLPIVEVGENYVCGWNPAELEALLEHQ
jgi:glutaredoxin-like YruB-family protein